MTRATALDHNLAVVTRDVRVFSRAGEKTLDPLLHERFQKPFSRSDSAALRRL